jgi:hypothetical protein
MVTQSDTVTIYHKDAPGSGHARRIVTAHGRAPARVVTPAGVELCGPAENVLALLPRA